MKVFLPQVILVEMHQGFSKSQLNPMDGLFFSKLTSARPPDTEQTDQTMLASCSASMLQCDDEHNPTDTSFNLRAGVCGALAEHPRPPSGSTERGMRANVIWLPATSSRWVIPI